MLFISRYIGQQKFGVVDTDDGVETVCTYSDIVEYVIDMGISIAGVETTYVEQRGKQRLAVRSVNPYQNPSSLTRDQVKMKMLNGVDVKTHGSQIVAIDIVGNALPNPVTIRLSDYGDTCGEYIFVRTAFVQGKLVIVLDDKVKLNSKSLKNFIDRGVVIDMREVKARKTIEYVSHELSVNSRWMEITAFDMVIDDSARIDFYKACTILQRETNYRPQIQHISDIVSHPAVINRQIAKKFKAEFMAIARAQYASVRQLRWANFTKQYVQFVNSSQGRELMARGRYEELRASRFVEMFGCFREVSTCNKNVLRRFENYVKYFDAVPEVQEAFVRFCRLGGEWLIELGRKQGWRM